MHHNRRISIEAFSRGTIDALNNSLAKPPSNRHRRQHSTASQLSNISITSDDSSATKKAPPPPVGEETPAIYRPEDTLPGTADGLPQQSQISPIRYSLQSIKSLFRRSAGAMTTYIFITKAGVVDQSDLEHSVSLHRRNANEIVTFKMAPDTYVGHSRLEETLKYLGDSLPNLQEIVLYSQVYTLEELNTLGPTLARFGQLRKFSIMDAMDDPPDVPSTLTQIVNIWASECPSLQQVRFKSDSWWEPRQPESEQTGDADSEQN
ncbi:hypothetical protein FRB99_000814, partial [Tulasnella sp. 403]